MAEPYYSPMSSGRSEEAQEGGRRQEIISPPAPRLPWYSYVVLPHTTVAPPPNPMWLYTESCAFKAATGVAIGAFAGGMMGLFFGLLGADPSVRDPVLYAVAVGPGGRAMPSIPLNESVATAWRSLGEKTLWYCKSFAVITVLFSGFDCVFEKARGKHDVVNGGLSGCATGAILAAKQGPQAACLGCAGFAAFSVAIDAVMHSGE